MIYTDVVFV